MSIEARLQAGKQSSGSDRPRAHTAASSGRGSDDDGEQLTESARGSDDDGLLPSALWPASCSTLRPIGHDGGRSGSVGASARRRGIGGASGESWRRRRRRRWRRRGRRRRRGWSREFVARSRWRGRPVGRRARRWRSTIWTRPRPSSEGVASLRQTREPKGHSATAVRGHAIDSDVTRTRMCGYAYGERRERTNLPPMNIQRPGQAADAHLFAERGR
jgi:hypothetical protein